MSLCDTSTAQLLRPTAHVTPTAQANCPRTISPSHDKGRSPELTGPDRELGASHLHCDDASAYATQLLMQLLQQSHLQRHATPMTYPLTCFSAQANCPSTIVWYGIYICRCVDECEACLKPNLSETILSKKLTYMSKETSFETKPV